MWYELKKLLKITGGGKRFAILLILRSPVDLCMTVIQAAYLQNAFNAVEQNDAGRLHVVCLTFMAAGLCIFLYNGIVWGIYSSFVVRMESRLRGKLFQKITNLPYERMEEETQGEWLTRLNTDVQMPFSQPIHLPHAVNAILRILVSAVILWIINPCVFGWVLVFAVPHVYISQLFVGSAMTGLNKKALEAAARNTEELSALITCNAIALIYDGQDYLMKRFEKSSLELLRTKMNLWKRHALNAALAILPFGLSGYLVLLLFSGGKIAAGHLTFGDLTAAFQYRLGVITGANMLINCLISIQTSMAGIHRINQTMYEKTEDSDG